MKRKVHKSFPFYYLNVPYFHFLQSVAFFFYRKSLSSNLISFSEYLIHMNIVLLQTDIAWQEPETNRNHAEELIDSLPESTGLVVLPEMFTTGFCTSPEGVAEKAGTETLVWMQSVALRRDMALAGSVATEENGNYYNRFYFVKPDGSYVTYNKRHLFTFAGEDKKYTAGNDRVIVEYDGFRILLQICYDLRFPVYSRNKGDYDMILYVANWPTVRLYAWNTLVRARAIENVCYVAAVNRTGNDPGGRYSGGTALYDFMGKPVAEAGTGEEAVSGTIGMQELADFRKKFPALQDADKFKLI
jgi:predicted amidohydrolase